MNKTIYMTYKKKVPDFVFTRWLKHNKDYQIEFSLDNHCKKFLKENINDKVEKLFDDICLGMHKADLWRLSKLYVNGGIYADIDLVPHIDITAVYNDNMDVTFFSCLSGNKCIFQAFIMNFYGKKNPLIYAFLLSFIINKAYGYPNVHMNEPTYDMYKCLKYMLNIDKLEAEKKYHLEYLKVKIHIGTHNTKMKEIDLLYFPDDIHYDINILNEDYNEMFDTYINDDKLYVTSKLDNGWNVDLYCDIIFKSKQTIFLFQQNVPSYRQAYVSYKGNKILDSRDPLYSSQLGWRI